MIQNVKYFNEIELIWTEFALLTSAHSDDLVYIHMAKYKRRLISNYCFIVPAKGLSYRTYYFILNSPYTHNKVLWDCVYGKTKAK